MVRTVPRRKTIGRPASGASAVLDPALDAALDAALDSALDSVMV